MTHKTEIFIHCLATKPEWMAGSSVHEKLEEVRRWHVQENGWSDIGYAAIIDLDGSVAYGRDLDGDGDFYEETAAAAKGYNKSAVHVALVGGFGSSADDLFSDHYTPEQDHELRREIERIKHWAAQNGGKIKAVRGHNEVANKACPGFNVKEWYKGRKPAKWTMPEISAPTITAVASAAGGAATTVDGLDMITRIGIFTVIVAALGVAAYIFAPIIRRKWR